MGRGDKKTRKGKITMGSWGVLRPRKTAVKIAVVSPAKAAKKEKAASAEKPAAKKTAKKKAEK